MPDIQKVCRHEVSHAIVAFEEGLTNFTRIFVDLLTPSTERKGGIDIDIPNLQTLSDSKNPLEDRRELALQIIATFAAGREGELLFGAPDPNWSEFDDEQIHEFAPYGVMTVEDVPLMEKDRSRGNGWSKWGEVDSLIAEGRERAKKILQGKMPDLRKTAKFFAGIITNKGKGEMKKQQLALMLGIKR